MPVVVLLALFVGVPLVEILVFVEAGAWIGGLATVGATLATAAAGAILFRRQGTAALARARESLRRGEAPLAEALNGAGLVAAAACLFVPGFVTDAFGFLLFVPPLRLFLAALAARPLLARGAAFRVGGFGGGPPGGDVIDGEYENITPDTGADRDGGGTDGGPPPPRPPRTQSGA